MLRIEGYVIVSTDGMIADANCVMPASIQNDADQHFFQNGLDHAAALVHGRHSHEGGPRAARRKRLVVSRQIAAIAPNPNYPNAMFWNPTGATLEQALAHIEVTDGIVAIIGGTGVFSMFLPRYDAFHLSHAAHAKIPGGRPVFAAVGPHATPEDVLMRHGLKPGPRRELDPTAGVSEVTWTR
ncbi:MAG: dihydrofolate reductase [Xanthobacteraceae bacterium]